MHQVARCTCAHAPQAVAPYTVIPRRLVAAAYTDIGAHLCNWIPLWDYVKIPKGLSAGMVIGSGGCNVKQLQSIAQCCVKVIQEEKRVLIVTADEAKLPSLVERLTLLMSLELEHKTGPSWCYIHPQVFASHGSYKFLLDVAFAHATSNLLACVDQGGNLFVWDLDKSTELTETQSALKVQSERSSTPDHAHHRLSWCPYVPAKGPGSCRTL